MKNRHTKKRKRADKESTPEQDLEITRWDQFIAVFGLAVGVYALSYFINTQDDLSFWLNQQEYSQTEFTVTEVKHVHDDDDVDIYLVGNVARTNQEIQFQDWLVYDPRLKAQPDYSDWSKIGNKAKIGVRFPIWFANDKLRIYYVSEFPEKPTNARALQCLLLNLTFFGLSFYCVARGFRKGNALASIGLQINPSAERLSND